MSSIENNPALIPPGAAGVGTGAGAGTSGSSSASNAAGRSFADELRQATGTQSLQFSKHAIERVQRRGIELDATTLKRLGEGVSRAESKGSRDSLVLVDGTAYVVSVRNHTVITAVDSEHAKDNVFTNIDSAVIA